MITERTRVRSNRLLTDLEYFFLEVVLQGLAN